MGSLQLFFRAERVGKYRQTDILDAILEIIFILLYSLNKRRTEAIATTYTIFRKG